MGAKRNRLKRGRQVIYLGRDGSAHIAVKAPVRIDWRRKVLRTDPCAYCGERPFGSRRHPSGTLDHIDPKASGGANAWWNLTGACQACNNAKADMSLLHYLLDSANAKTD